MIEKLIETNEKWHKAEGGLIQADDDDKEFELEIQKLKRKEIIREQALYLQTNSQ